jgi:hypothetical protein
MWNRFTLAGARSASVFGDITAVSRVPNSMEVWWVGTGATVQGAYWYEGQPWKRYELAPAGSASADGSFTAVSRVPNSMEVWWVGTEPPSRRLLYEGQPGSQYNCASRSAWEALPRSRALQLGRSGGSEPASVQGACWWRASLSGTTRARRRFGRRKHYRGLARPQHGVWWVRPNPVQGAYWYEGQPWKRYEPAPATRDGSITTAVRAFQRSMKSGVGTEASVKARLLVTAGQPLKRCSRTRASRKRFGRRKHYRGLAHSRQHGSLVGRNRRVGS